MNTAKKWIAAFSAGLFALSACSNAFDRLTDYYQA